ncbi:hypothetical protein [Euzebya pacifica]|nr:hypothetical protein [Euzebya pacifica]
MYTQTTPVADARIDDDVLRVVDFDDNLIVIDTDGRMPWMVLDREGGLVGFHPHDDTTAAAWMELARSLALAAA